MGNIWNDDSVIVGDGEWWWGMLGDDRDVIGRLIGGDRKGGKEGKGGVKWVIME